MLSFEPIEHKAAGQHRESMKKNKISSDEPRTQYAALPFRIVDGFPQVMLVTSRETRRWVLPKGWPEKDHKPWQLAAREAYEEAGLIGRIEQKSIGSYHYNKWLDEKTFVPCQVSVFVMQVERQLEDWPEKSQRETRWFTPGQAAMLVDEGGLVRLLLGFGAVYA